MNIAFFVPDLRGGGAERAVVNLLRHWPTRRNAPPRPLLIVRQLIGPYVQSLPEGCAVRSLDIPGNGLRESLMTSVRLARVLDAERVDLVIGFLSHPSVALATALCRRRVRLYASVQTAVQAFLQDIEANQPRRRFFLQALALTRREIERYTERYLPLSTGLAKELIEQFGVPAAKVTVLPNSVGLREVVERAREPADLSPHDERDFIVTTAARLVFQKGLDTFLVALAQLNWHDRRVHWVVIGEGDQRAELQAQAKQLGIASRVSFVGFRPNPWALMARSNAFVLPSRYEGFGNVLLEAMACRVPVIATDAPHGPRDIIQNGVSGLLTPVEDPMGLAQSVEMLMDDPDLCRRLVEGGWARASQYDAPIIAERLIDLMQGNMVEAAQ